MSKSSPLLVEIGQGLSIMMGLPTINSWTTTERPQNPKPGTFGFNAETKSLEYWDGSRWLGALMT